MNHALQSSPSDVLEDKAYHGILEALFCAAKVECSTYANASKSASKTGSKTKSASRLSECASVLGLAVRVGVRKLRFKTVKAFIEHVSQTLPMSDGLYCEPLVADYFKALRIVLEYPPHPEHLLKEDWHDAIDFCNASIHDLNNSFIEDGSSFPSGVRGHDSFADLASRSSTPSFHGDSLRNTSSRVSRQRFNPQLRGSAEDLIFCVRHLTSVSNAPVLEKASVTLDALFDLLQMSPHLGNAQQAAFESINSIIVRITTDDTSLVLQTLRKLVPLIRRFWQAKSAGLREMLTSMVYGEIYLNRLLKSDSNGDCRADLLGLLEILRVEYCKRIERDQLQLDDIDLSDHTFRTNRHMPLSTRVCELRLGATKAEQPWALLQNSASILLAIHSESDAYETPNGNADLDPPLKRQKMAGVLDDLLQFTKGPSASEKLYALQVLLFVFDQLTVDIGTLEGILDLLLPCASDDNGSIASWAIMALTWYVTRLLPHQIRFTLTSLIVSLVRKQHWQPNIKRSGSRSGILQRGTLPPQMQVELHVNSWQSR